MKIKVSFPPVNWLGSLFYVFVVDAMSVKREGSSIEWAFFFLGLYSLKVIIPP